MGIRGQTGETFWKKRGSTKAIIFAISSPAGKSYLFQLPRLESWWWWWCAAGRYELNRSKSSRGAHAYHPNAADQPRPPYLACQPVFATVTVTATAFCRTAFVRLCIVERGIGLGHAVEVEPYIAVAYEYRRAKKHFIRMLLARMHCNDSLRQLSKGAVARSSEKAAWCVTCAPLGAADSIRPCMMPFRPIPAALTAQTLVR